MPEPLDPQVLAARTGRPRLAALHLRRAERLVRSPQTRATVARARAVVEPQRC